MRKLELKDLRLEDGTPFVYRNELLALLSRVDLPRVGEDTSIDLETVERFLALRRIIKASDGFALLEEDQWATLAMRVRTSRWIVADAVVLVFASDVLSCPVLASAPA